MQVGLFEALNGQFADGTPLEAVGEDQHRLMSVIDNLNRLFNHRQKAIDHLPEYGLPDLTEIYRDNPETIEFLRGAIRDAVERYEPRLQRVRVVRQPVEDDQEGRLVFLLSGQLVGGYRVQFQTTFAKQVHVNPARS